MLKTALITGIGGQDGSYLAELLVANNYRVIGIVRNKQNPNISNLIHIKDKIELVQWDMINQQLITDILLKYQPSEIYNFAAYSSGSGMFDNPLGIAEINGISVVKILESIREVNVDIRFCQASSREIFGEASVSPQSEMTMTKPRSPYGAAKQYADSMIRIYREQYKLFACSAILFNHESPRRGLEFVTRKITHTAAKIKLGLADELHLGNLETFRDWGFAGDSVNAMWLMLQNEYADDYVIATGEVHSVRDFCECAFKHLGLDYCNYVRENVSDFRPSENVKLVGNSTKAREILGWKPRVGFTELVHMMVDADLNSLKNNFI